MYKQKEVKESEMLKNNTRTMKGCEKIRSSNEIQYEITR